MTTTISARASLGPDGITGPLHIEVDDGGRIASLRPASGPVPDVLLTPGFVDLQVNGIDDVDCARADGGDWGRLDELLIAQGTTSWCPTLISSPLPGYEAPLARIAAAMSRRPGGPEILGVHLEGPFLGRALGAHLAEFVVPVDLEWLAALPAHVRLVTLGAEQPLATDAIRQLRQQRITVSIGHSRPSTGEFEAAVEAGASMVTHLYNAMSGADHRAPGLAAFALTEPGVRTGLIVDLVHVHPRMVRLAFAAQPPGSVVLVTDATAWRAGTAGALRIERRDGAPRLADGTLAGSCLTMDAAVRNAVASGVGLAAALVAASTSPAAVLGATDRGVIEVGRRADLTALDDSLAVREVFVGGQRVR